MQLERGKFTHHKAITESLAAFIICRSEAFKSASGLSFNTHFRVQSNLCLQSSRKSVEFGVYFFFFAIQSIYSLTMAAKKAGVIALFDVDGTLTAPRKEAAPETLRFMQELRKIVTVGVVGGSDLVKISEQLGKTVTSDYDFVFSENGLVAHKAGNLIGTQSLKTYLGEEKLKEIINFTLHYIADLDIPIKRGTFIEFRSGMLNVSPIGRNCSQEERDEFEKYDKIHNVRSKMVTILREKFAHFNLTFSIGGQISFDVFPQGWDKTYCLRYLDDFQDIHFFGDKTYQGGNDFEIYESDRTVGHTVASPDDTIKQCTTIFLGKKN